MTNIRTLNPRPSAHFTADAWFRWALDQFPFLEYAPRPEIAAEDDALNSVANWTEPFLKWLASGAGDARKRTVGQLVLFCWNDSLEVPGALRLERAYAGMDNDHRRGVRVLLEHMRHF